MTVKAERDIKTAKFLVAILLIFVFVIVISSLAIKHFESFGFEHVDNGIRYTRSDLGTLGDFIGGLLNPILTFLTVCLLIWSIRIQMVELRLTREELKRANENRDYSVKLQYQNIILPIVASEFKNIELNYNNCLDRKLTTSSKHIRSISLNDIFDSYKKDFKKYIVEFFYTDGAISEIELMLTILELNSHLNTMIEMIEELKSTEVPIFLYNKERHSLRKKKQEMQLLNDVFNDSEVTATIKKASAILRNI
jgi:hypothetical protein